MKQKVRIAAITAIFTVLWFPEFSRKELQLYSLAYNAAEM